MALQNTDLLPLYRITDSSNRKISVADFTTYLSNSSQAPVIISDTAPNPATEGQLYWDITDATLYVYYDNAGNGVWVPATPVPETSDLTKIDGGTY